MNTSMVQLAYGRTRLGVELPTDNLLGVFRPKPITTVPDEDKLIAAALTDPLGTPQLREIPTPGSKVAIVTSDMTRPCPSPRLLPYVLSELAAAGIPDDDIFIVLALGLHREMTPEEVEATVSSEIRNRYRVLSHDSSDTVYLGATSHGTPVEFFRPLVEEADVRICLGNVEFHYFAGYSGGAKAIFPGCASKAGVTANHAMMVRPEAAAGIIEGNPVRADIEQAVGMLGVDFILNVVVDEKHKVVGAFAGDMIAAHRKGCELVAVRGKVKIPQLADIVIASPGGYPKDINLYQAQKALDNARYFARDSGVIILVAECTEGFGNPTFETWLLNAASPRELLERIQEEFVIGGHKAAAIASVQTSYAVNLVSELPNNAVLRGGMIPFGSVQQAFDIAIGTLGGESKVIVLPQAGSILPDTGG
jgi:nickel-dependent lactate racemase